MARLRTFLVSKDREASRRAIRAIRQGVRLLTEYPAIGHVIEGYPDEYREWFIAFGGAGYVIRYRIGAGQIIVLTVRHAREAGL